jgi:hypothetical protein
MNALTQVSNLKTYPVVREKLSSGELRIHSWYYDIGKSELEQWDEKKKMFVNVGGDLEAENEPQEQEQEQEQEQIKTNSDSLAPAR